MRTTAKIGLAIRKNVTQKKGKQEKKRKTVLMSPVQSSGNNSSLESVGSKKELRNYRITWKALFFRDLVSNMNYGCLNIFCSTLPHI